MIKIGRKESKVIVQVKHGIFFGEEYFELEINQGSDYQAELLKRQLQDFMETKLQIIRRDAYLEGWKDAKAKTKKKTSRQEFHGTW